MQADDKVLEFAAGELKRFYGDRADQFRLTCGDNEQEGFQISRNKGGIEIHGNNSRSLLFGVYALLRRYAGCRWFHPGEEIVTKGEVSVPDLRKPWKEEPSISRRFIIPSGTRTLELARKYIEWAPRNLVGDISFISNRWPEWREALTPEIEKRGLKLRLSGHCLPLFIPKNNIAEHPEWFAEVNGTRIENGQYCFSSQSFRRALSEKIIDFLKNDRVIDRMLLLAEDNALKCECSECRKREFLQVYVECVDEVARTVREKIPHAKIDFSAYNAGGAWDMLKPESKIKFSHCNLEVGFWGRDYRYRLQNSKTANDRKAWKCLRNWIKADQGDVWYQEYYSDLWMLSHLIPPLPRRISEDCRDFAAIGLDGLGDLIVLRPRDKRDNNFVNPNFDKYVPLTFPNLYFTGAFGWNARQSLQSVLEDYGRYRHGADGRLCMGYLQMMEKTFAVISSFNLTLFRDRFEDIWARDTRSKEGGIEFKRFPWSPENHVNGEEVRRRKVCSQMIRWMKRYEKAKGWKFKEKDPACLDRSRTLKTEWTLKLQRLRAMLVQLNAQEAICRKDSKKAKSLLDQALAMEAGVLGSEKEICKGWIDAVAKGVWTVGLGGI